MAGVVPVSLTSIREATFTARRHRAMSRTKFLKLLRLMKYAKQSSLRPVFVCPRCQEATRLEHGDGTITGVGTAGGINPKRDRFSLRCGCTVWTVGV